MVIYWSYNPNCFAYSGEAHLKCISVNNCYSKHWFVSLTVQKLEGGDVRRLRLMYIYLTLPQKCNLSQKANFTNIIFLKSGMPPNNLYWMLPRFHLEYNDIDFHIFCNNIGSMNHWLYENKAPVIHHISTRSRYQSTNMDVIKHN